MERNGKHLNKNYIITATKLGRQADSLSSIDISLPNPRLQDSPIKGKFRLGKQVKEVFEVWP